MPATARGGSFVGCGRQEREDGKGRDESGEDGRRYRRSGRKKRRDRTAKPARGTGRRQARQREDGGMAHKKDVYLVDNRLFCVPLQNRKTEMEMEGTKKSLLGLSLQELKTVARELGMPAFAGAQMAKWLYGRHVAGIDAMTDISKANRERLKAEYTVGCAAPTDMQKSKDGTIKYLFPTADGKFVETVYIPDNDRATLCVSSQVGCRMNCLFCQTGKQGFSGNLSAGDILNQIYSLPERDKLTNIVFMGQGEPMDNLDAVLRATEILTADYGYAWSPKRITVSSVGVRGKLKRFLEESDCHVAISLHSPLPDQRASLMPAEHGMPIEDVVEMLRNYDFSHQRRLSFEYIVFRGVNDTEQHAKAIIRLLRGLDCRINLIRFHKIPDVDLDGADDATMERMRDYLTHHGVFTTIRASRGQDIFAACGLLSTAKQVANGRA